MTPDEAMRRLLTPIGYAVRSQYPVRYFPLYADWLRYKPRWPKIKVIRKDKNAKTPA